MSPRERKNMAASVKQRLLDLAKARGEEFNFLLARYAVERLLFRLEQSEHGRDIALTIVLDSPQENRILRRGPPGIHQ
jgi:hypothetical protein